MATIDQCKKQTEFIAGKSGYGAYLSPDNFDLLFNKAQLQYFNALYKNYYATQRISDSLSVFKSDPLPIVIPGDGVYSLDPNFKVLHIDAITHVYNGKPFPVIRVEDDKLANHLSSEYDAPDLQFPIYTKYKSSIKFNPVNLATASMVYFKSPATVKWNYTIVNQRAVYSATGSTHPEWADNDIENIINLILVDLAQNMNDQNLQNYSARKNQQGS